MTRNQGICEKDSRGERKHNFVIREREDGYQFRTCEKCGTTPLKPRVQRVIEKELD